MNKLDIELEVSGVDMNFRVEYTYERGEQQITHLAPEDCCEGSADEITVDTMQHFVVNPVGSEILTDAWYLIDPNYEFI